MWATFAPAISGTFLYLQVKLKDFISVLRYLKDVAYVL